MYLDQVKGVTVNDTPAMVEVEYTFEEAVKESRRTPISSRELYVEDRSLDIRGYIDELVLSPDGFTVIDDKPVGRSRSTRHRSIRCMGIA